ncbi:14 kDa phosphohistidine phosphatase-like isoform X2 [Daphnia pulicaria]|uniref:14 kDa phosphohistidine phosphatase-like isoform X2 n=1 Tax=Daphnia pulicaria TaxID=35523 RepID=UPI001EEA6384|nr:14 kDa phosphohistidine phosphatase-like isoform X2 [Daphnia pulicaria]
MHTALLGITRIFSSTGRIPKLQLAKSMATLPAKLDAIPAVDIDSGRFKYVLIRVDLQDDAETKQEFNKVIVRGYNWASFHADIYDKVQEELEAVGFDTECLGGGRILHDPSKRSIQVYGYSQGFGLADHAVTTELLKARYPDYESITWTNEGY